jgi:hypothetical protein
LLQLARDWLRSQQIVRPSVEVRYRRGLALLVTVRWLRPTTGSHRC